MTKHLGGAQIWCKDVSAINGDAHKAYHATANALICKESNKKAIAGDTGAGMFGKNLAMAAKEMKLKAKILWYKRYFTSGLECKIYEKSWSRSCSG